jgi:hypothetical protein
VRREILVRNGLSSLVRNITARPCETLLPPNLTGPKGGLRPSKRGLEPAIWVPAASYRNNTLFLLRTDSTYLCTYIMVSHTRVARREPGLARKVTYSSRNVSQPATTTSSQRKSTDIWWEKTSSTKKIPTIQV